jgi:hypothetical protein
VPFNFGVPKKIWDSSRSRICELGIWEIGIPFVKLMNSFICQIEVWGVFLISVKFGVVCTSGQLLSMWTWQKHKSWIVKDILGHNWFFLYVWCVMGMEVLSTRFSGVLWTRKTKHGQLSSRKRDRRDFVFRNL